MTQAARSGRNAPNRTEPHGSEDLLLPLLADPAVIGSAAEMAALLSAASPARARQFALFMHECACERAEDAEPFWSQTLASLTHQGG